MFRALFFKLKHVKTTPSIAKPDNRHSEITPETGPAADMPKSTKMTMRPNSTRRARRWRTSAAEMAAQKEVRQVFRQSVWQMAGQATIVYCSYFDLEVGVLMNGDSAIAR